LPKRQRSWTISRGLWSFGTVDAVRKDLVDEWKQVPYEFLTLIYHYAQMPKEAVIDNLDISCGRLSRHSTR
jgi:hypothetical protein